MAHEIDRTVRKEGAAFYAGEPAWHGLGTVVAEVQTAEAAIDLAGMDWEVKQCPVFALAEGDYLEIPDRRANIRSDSGALLGEVSKWYRPWQNREAFRFMDAIVGEGLASYETAGCLFGGRKVWILARLPKTIQVAAHDDVKPYLLLVNGHDGSTALKILPTTVRVVCNNTLRLATRTAGQCYAIAHLGKLEEKVEAVRLSLGLVYKDLEQFEVEAARLRDAQVGYGQQTEYLSEVASEVTRTEQARDRLLEHALANLQSPTNLVGGMEGTLWAAYNAVSQFADHQMVYGPEANRADRRMSSIVWGRANAIKQTAWTMALALAN